MDAIDYKILNIVQARGRVTVKQIAEEVFISSPSVSVRLQNLEAQGYITNYQAHVDFNKLGFLIKAYVHCEVKAVNKQAFYTYVDSIVNVIECDLITGDYSMLLKVYFKTTSELDDFIADLQQFGDTKTHIVFSTSVGPRGMQFDANKEVG